MTNLRAEKIERISRDIPPAAVTSFNREPTATANGPATARNPGKAELLVVSWGSTYGSVAAAVSGLQEAGRAVDHLHLRYLNPFPANLGTLLGAYKRVLVPENNMGQLCMLLRAKYLVDAQSLAKVEGRAFRVSELIEHIGEVLDKST
jgi:2-oxoglutarate ferredoxin oxidoreductase subunit alpha